MQPLTINFKPSKILASMLILAGLFAISMVLLVPVDRLVKAGLVIWIVFFVGRAVARYAFLEHTNAVLSLYVNHLNVTSVAFKHRKEACIILPTTTVTAYLLVIQLALVSNIHGEHNTFWQTKLQSFNPLALFNTQTIIVMPDSIAGDYPQETMRQLRVWLRLASQKQMEHL